MASKGVTTDLVIRAKEIQTKPLADLVSLLGRLTGALSDLDKEGGPATRNVAELRSEAEKFAAISSELSARRGLFQAFTSARDGAKLAADALEQAKKRLAEFSEALPAAKQRTEAQKQDFAALSKSVKDAGTSLRNAERVAASSAQALARIGVDAATAASELLALADADKIATDGFERATRNVQGYHQAVRDLAKATTEKAAADKLAADAARRAEQAESDRLALLEQAGRRQLAATGKAAAADENARLAEAVALTKKLADANAATAKAARVAEQAESDRLAALEQIGRRQLAATGKVALAAENASIAEAIALTKKLADARAAAAKAAVVAARRSEQAESDRLALLEQVGRRQLAATGKVAAADENARLAEAAALTKKLADANAAAAKASRAAEQAESDRIARILERGRAEQQAGGRVALAAENASIAEAAALTKRLADAKAEAARVAKAENDAVLATTRSLQQQREAELAAAYALRERGNAAAEAAAESRKLAAAAEEVAKSSAGAGLAGQVVAIVNPSKAAALSLTQVTDALAGLEARQKQANSTLNPSRELIKQLGEDHEFLARALRDTERQASAIEGYRKVSAEMERTGAALRAAQDALEQYAAQARAAGTSDDALEQGLATQRTQLAALTTAYAAQAAAVARMASQMKAAGVEVSDLARSEAEVVSNASRLRGAMDAATSSTTALGNATARAKKEQSAWGEEQRTALSLTQRIRGQILSLTAAYVGLFGVINEAKASLDAVTTIQGATNRLAVAFGDDPAIVTKEMSRLREEADRLGISLQESANGYSKFAIASTSAGMTADETFYIFSKFSEVGRVFKLSGEEQGRVFKALEQMMSKGKISAEELTQQLGDVLPGAVSKMAKALYGSSDATAKLFKDMEAGKVSSRNLLLFAQEFGDSVATKVEPASRSWQAELARMQNSLLEFRAQVANGGFADAMGSLARTISTALSGDEGKQFASDLGAAFSFVADTLRMALPVLQGFMSALRDVGTAAGAAVTGVMEMVAQVREFLGLKASTDVLDLNESLRELGRLLALLAGLWGVSKIVAFSSAIATAAASTTALTTAVGKLPVVMTAVQVAAVALAGFELGTWLVNNTNWAKKLVVALSHLASITAHLVSGNLAAVSDEWALWGQRLAEIDAKASSLKNRAATGAGGGRGMVNPETVTPRISEAPSLGGAAKDKAAATAAKSLKDEYAALLKMVESGTKALELRGAKKGANEVEEAVAAIELQYKDLFASIAKLSAADQAKFLPRAEAAKAKVIAEVRAEMEAKAAQAKVEALVAERDALIDVAKAQAGLDTSKAITEEARLMAEYRVKLLEAAQAALVLADAQGKTLDAAKLRGQIARLEAQNPDQEARRAQLAALQAEITRLTAERDARISASAAKATATGEPTDASGLAGLPADAERVAIMTEYQSRLQNAAVSARELALSLGDPTAAASLDVLIAQLTVVDTKAAEIRTKLTTDLQQGLADVGVAAVEGFAGFIAGANGIGAAFQGMRDSFKSFAKSFLSQIVQMIIKAQVLAAWQAITGMVAGGSSVGGSAGAGNAAGIGVGIAHNGGVIGSGSRSWARSVPAAVFAGAAAFHTGGLPGLKSDEVPTILQKGEEVLSRDNPRNVLNGGMMTAAAPAQPQSIKIVNTIDAGDAVSQGLSTPAGDRAFINRVVANKATIKKLLT